MKKYLIILALLLPLVTVGQNWCPNGATWYYTYWNIWDQGYWKIQYDGDTIINSIQCKKLSRFIISQFSAFPTQDTSISYLGTSYTYADSNKVYIFKHNQFYTLYDFSAQIGNTWIVPELTHYAGCDTVGIVRVDSIGTTEINGQNLRYVCVSPADSDQKLGWTAKIIERIGPVKAYFYYPFSYLFPQKLDNCGLATDEVPEGGNLRCYDDNTPFSFSTNIAPYCNFILSTNSYDRISDKVRVYPNPSNNMVTIDLEQSLNVCEIYLTDILGNIVFRQQTNNQTRIKIENLKSGIYILKAIDKDNGMTNKTIISCP